MASISSFACVCSGAGGLRSRAGVRVDDNPDNVTIFTGLQANRDALQQFVDAAMGLDLG